MAVSGAASAQSSYFFYQMNEPTWTGPAPQVVDSSGNSNNGTVVGGPNTVSDPTYGQVGGFNNNGYVQVDGSGTISGGRTLTAWVYVPAFNTPRGMPIAEAGVMTAGDFFGVGGTGGENWGVPQYSLYVDNWGSRDYFSTAVVTPGQWNFVAFAMDGANTIDFYVNGAPMGSSGGAAQFNWDLSTVQVGGGTLGGTTTNQYLTGDLRDVALWTTQLTPGQVQSLYQSEAVPEPTALAVFAVGLVPLLIRRRRK